MSGGLNLPLKLPFRTTSCPPHKISGCFRIFTEIHSPQICTMSFLIARNSRDHASEFKASLPPPNADDGHEVKRRRRWTVAGIDQNELLDPELLADPDSRFAEFEGVHIHHKIYHHAEEPRDDRSGTIGIPMILLHGFGASVFSWSRVMKPLAELTGSEALSFDRPAFGLTSRVEYSGHSSSAASPDAKPLNPYSMPFSVLATLNFVHFLGAKQAILVGHSAGAYVAVNAYFKDPERVAALILVAPAILAPVQKSANKISSKNKHSSEDSSDSIENSVTKILRAFLKFAQYIKQPLRLIVEVVASVLTSLCRQTLSAILRSAIGVIMIRTLMDKFGIAAVRAGWYDPKQISEHIIEGYTKPLKAKNWDKALLEFTVSLLTDPGSKMEPPLRKRLHQISCPVLIITGDTDRIVPAWNAKRLQRAIPGSYLEIIKNCGHLPQEERAEEFIAVVDRFLKRTLGGSTQQLGEQAIA